MAIHRFELFLGCFIGAITFTASVFAYLASCRRKKWAKSLKGGWVKPVQIIAGAGHAGFRCGYFASENLKSFMP
jgi:NAD(P) transhydrogenase subunit beta